MAQLIDIRRVAVAPQHFTARVTIANGGPLTTDEDLVGTTHVYHLLPEITEHACLGDAGETFKYAMGATELAHLLEHVAIELMARTGLGDDISCGRTWEVTGEPRTYDVQLSCPDDVLVASALSSAAWILQWAYSGGADPKPDVEAIVAGIRELVENADEIAAREAAKKAAADEGSDAPADEPASDGQVGDEPADADPAGDGLVDEPAANELADAEPEAPARDGAAEDAPAAEAAEDASVAEAGSESSTNETAAAADPADAGAENGGL